MVNYKSNKPYYKLNFSSLGKDELRVLSFEGEEAISRLFEYRFELISKNPQIQADDVLNKTASFELIRGEEDPVSIHGIISRFKQLEQSYGKNPDYTYYEAVLVPRFWRLLLNYRSVVFQKMDIQTLISTVLENAGMISDDYRFDLNASYPEMEYAVQFRETDFDFINRRCEHYGIFYYFDHSNGTDILVFADSNDTFPAIEPDDDIIYNSASQKITDKETITQFTYEQKVVTGLFRLKDYNYRQPNTSLLVEEQIDTDAPGEYYDYGDHYKDVSEGEFLAKIRNEEILCGSKLFHGKSDCKLLRSGHVFRMDKHYRSDWNAEMIVTHLVSQGDQRALFAYVPVNKTLKFYENQFTAISIENVFRPGRITPIPQISGIMTARMESAGSDEYAYLDDQGRYRVKMPFDLSDAGDGKASRQIRMSQPYSGAGYGIHFPNHKDTEMVWACINGNADRPLALGTVPNPSNTSPSVSSNKQQNVIRTAAGSELIMDDKTDEAQILINTPDANNMLFDDKDDKIQVTTTQKNTVILDDKNQNITVQTTDGHVLIMDDKNTKITVQSKNGHRISINDESGGENITLVDESGENTFLIDITNQKLVIKTENGDIDFHAPNGMIDIQAKTLSLNTSEDAAITIGANKTEDVSGDCELTTGGNLSVEAGGDYEQKAVNITSEASMDHSSKGMNMTLEASMENKIKGMNITSEAGVNQEVKGSMVTVQSSGPNTIKGMPVMIN